VAGAVAGCYALILNNDNGLSSDNGDEVVYAGGGGRHRGQNRSAPQSFHQVTLSHESREKKMRQLHIRLQSNHDTCDNQPVMGQRNQCRTEEQS